MDATAYQGLWRDWGYISSDSKCCYGTEVIGREDDDADFVRQMNAIEDLVLDEEKETYCQPCVSPIWDTCLSLSALSEGGAPGRSSCSAKRS